LTITMKEIDPSSLIKKSSTSTRRVACHMFPIQRENIDQI